MDSSKKKFIAVIGGSAPSPEDTEIAEKVGREIARHGAVLVCGGLGGVMEASCRGAHAEGGLTVGILPGDNPATANPYISIPIVTGIGYARNPIVVKSSRAVIAVDGSYGTLTEIAYAIQHGIPVVGLNTWSFSRKGKTDHSIIQAENPAQAVELALDLAE